LSIVCLIVKKRERKEKEKRKLCFRVAWRT